MDYVYWPCPVNGCTNKTTNYWYHDYCGGKLLFRYSDIYVMCSECDEEAILFVWKWSCGRHAFKRPSQQSCIFALAIMGQAYGNESQIRQAIMKLL